MPRFSYLIGCTTGEAAMGAGLITNQESFEGVMKDVFEKYLNIKPADDQFWTDLEQFYLPNHDITLADADDWRKAYIDLGLDTQYTWGVHDFSNAAAQDGAQIQVYSFAYAPTNFINDPPRCIFDNI